MRMILICSLAFLPFNGMAQAEPRAMSGSEIADLLPTIVANGDDTRQTFSASGATTYVDKGRETYGTWRVEADTYCSQWPPVREWACFAVIYDAMESRLVWIAHNGEKLENTVSPK